MLYQFALHLYETGRVYVPGPHHFGDLASLMVGKVHCNKPGDGRTCGPGPDCEPNAKYQLPTAMCPSWCLHVLHDDRGLQALVFANAPLDYSFHAVCKPIQ